MKGCKKKARTGYFCTGSFLFKTGLCFVTVGSLYCNRLVGRQ